MCELHQIGRYDDMNESPQVRAGNFMTATDVGETEEKVPWRQDTNPGPMPRRGKATFTCWAAGARDGWMPKTISWSYPRREEGSAQVELDRVGRGGCVCGLWFGPCGLRSDGLEEELL